MSNSPLATCFRIFAFVLILSGRSVMADCIAASHTVATVDGAEITQAELDGEFLIRRIPAERQGDLRALVINDLIDRRLVAAWLDQRKAPLPEPELDSQLALLKRAVEAGGQGSLADALAKRGLSEQQLRDQLALPLRWKAHIRRTVTDQQLRDYFESLKIRFDGTQVRVRQIVISIPPDSAESAWAAADATLQRVRSLISDGKLKFEDAAREHSTSPSGKLGGDLGFISYRGRVPPEVAAAAFALEPGELSGVIRSSFGLHLVQVIERKPGEYSLEDVREQVWEQKTREAWNDHIATARKTAKIQIVAPTP